MRKLILGACLLLNSVGCGFSFDDLVLHPNGKPDFVLNHTIPVYDHRKDKNHFHFANAQARLEIMVDSSLNYWGGNWHDLDGYAIEIVDDYAFNCITERNTVGCTNGITKTIRITSAGYSCIEEMVLAHEIGHAVLPLNDPFHFSDGFRGLGAVFQDYTIKDMPYEEDGCVTNFADYRDGIVYYGNMDEKADFKLLNFL